MKRMKKLMSKVIIVIAMTFPGISHAQETKKGPRFWRNQGIAFGLAMNAGYHHRTAEIRKDDYRRIAAVKKNEDPQWGNPRLSFRNKYENWPEDQSPRFFLSTTLLVGATDAFHGNNTVAAISMAGCVSFSITLWEKPKIKHMLIQGGLTWAGYGLGRKISDMVYPKID